MMRVGKTHYLTNCTIPGGESESKCTVYACLKTKAERGNLRLESHRQRASRVIDKKKKEHRVNC